MDSLDSFADFDVAGVDEDWPGRGAGGGRVEGQVRDIAGMIGGRMKGRRKRQRQGGGGGRRDARAEQRKADKIEKFVILVRYHQDTETL